MKEFAFVMPLVGCLNINGKIYDYFHEDIAKFQEIMKFSQKEGLDNASSL